MPRDKWKKENNRAKYGQTRSRYPKLHSEKPSKKVGKKKRIRKKRSAFITKFIKKEVAAIERLKVAKTYVREIVLENIGFGNEATETQIEAEIKKELKNLEVKERGLKAKLEVAKRNASKALAEFEKQKAKLKETEKKSHTEDSTTYKTKGGRKKAKEKKTRKESKEVEEKRKQSRLENSPAFKARQKSNKKTNEIKKKKVRRSIEKRKDSFLKKTYTPPHSQ